MASINRSRFVLGVTLFVVCLAIGGLLSFSRPPQPVVAPVLESDSGSQTTQRSSHNVGGNPAESLNIGGANHEPAVRGVGEFGSITPPNFEEDSGASDPVALIVVIPHYATLGTLISEVDPARQFAESLALGRYRVTVLMGTVNSTQGYDTFYQLREQINEFNSTVIMNKGRKYHHVEVRSTPFHTVETLQEEIKNWMSAHFANGQRTPFGVMAFRGHGEYRETADQDKIRDILLMPNEQSGEGGLQLKEVKTLASWRRAPLFILWDMCREETTGDAPKAIEPPKKDHERKSVETRCNEQASLVAKIPLARKNSHRAEILGQASNIVFSVPPFQRQELQRELSSIAVIGQGLQLLPNQTRLELKSVQVDRPALNDTQANCFELFQYFRKMVENRPHKNDEFPVSPLFTQGPISRRKILYSLDEDFVYSPVEFELVGNVEPFSRQALQVDLEDGAPVFRRVKTVGYDDAVYATLVLNAANGPQQSGIVIDEPNLYLVVTAQVESTIEKSLEFLLQPSWGTTFVSSQSGRVNRAASHDGVELFWVPLDKGDANSEDEPARVTSVSISSKVINLGSKEKNTEALNKSWDEAASLRILSMRVLREEELLDEIRSHISEDQNATAFLAAQRSGVGFKVPMRDIDLQERWWPDQLLQCEKLPLVERSWQEDNNGQLQHKIKMPEGISIGGIEGALSPGVFVDPKRHELEIEIEFQGRPGASPKMGLVMESLGEDSESKVLLSTEIDLRDRVTPKPLPILQVGYARWLSIVASGCDQLTIRSLKLVSAKKSSPQ